MSEHGNDSDNDDDDFGADVGTLAKAPKLIMKRFHDVVDQIGPLYQASLININLMHRFNNNCWYLICSKVR
jgi:hypothetical protein